MTNRKLAAWSVLAIVIGAPLSAPGTSVIIPALIATRPDSVCFYFIPLLGMGLVAFGAIILMRTAIRALASRL